MHTLLLAENSNKAQFIQNGLRCENLSTDILSLKASREHLLRSLHVAHGVFIFDDQVSVSMESTIDFCLNIRNELPIIVLSSGFQLSTFEMLYNLGKIRNFFVRPFPFRLIASEMRTNVFQEREKVQSTTLQRGDIVLNRDTREIKVSGKSIYLRNKEFALLEFLMLNEGKVLSRETILEHVWDRNANIFTNTVDVHINKLRKKIKSTENFIRTIPCSGYLIS